MTRSEKALWLAAIVMGLAAGLLLIYGYWEARAQQVYRILDTTREQFLAEEPGALGSRSILTFTAVSRIGDGDVQLLPLGVVGEWEELPSPLLPYPIEAPAAVLYSEPDPPYRQRIYLIGGYKPTPVPAERLDTVYTCDVLPNGGLSEWTLQANRLPLGLSSAAAALSTQDVNGDPITPTIYVLGGKYPAGTSDQIYYAQIDPVTLDVGTWQTSGSTLGGPRLGLSAVANDGYLYAIGGFNPVSNQYSAAVWHFSLGSDGEPYGRSVEFDLPGSDPDNNPNAVYHQTALVAGVSPFFPTDTLYVIGGYNADNSTPRVLRGDIYLEGPERGYIQDWVDIPGDDLPQALSAFGVALGDVQGAGRQVYIVGGDQGTAGGDPQNTIRSAAVDDEQNSFYNWYGLAWLTSPALPAARYRHAVVQTGEYIFAIAGHGLGQQDYYRNVLRGHLVGTGARQYAPSGIYLSRVVDLGRKYRLTWLDWTSTITPTDPGVTMTLQFRFGNRPDLSDAQNAWSEWIPTNRGQQAQTLVPVPPMPNFPFYPPIARYVQYRAALTTTAAFSNVTPMLHEVGMHVEDSPDLVVSNVAISCDGCYGSLGIISRTIVVQVTVRNQGGLVPLGNNFFSALFITTTGGYQPQPPDWPTDPNRFLPGSSFWPMQGAEFPSGGERTLSTTIFFTEAKSLYLYALADYNDTSPPPDYDVGEVDPENNLTVFFIVILDPQSASATETAWYWATQTAKPPPTTPSGPSKYRAFFPLIVRGYASGIYVPLATEPPITPSPLPALQPPPAGRPPGANGQVPRKEGTPTPRP